MRKFLLTLTALAGAAVAATGAHAAPALGPVPFAAAPPAVQPVQYYEDWRYREWRRHEAFERWRRHEAWRRWRYEHRGPYAYGGPPPGRW